MQPSFRRRRESGGFLCLGSVLTLLIVWAAPGRACFSDRVDSVHFHSGKPDFGTPPRRGALNWRGEHDDRPPTGDGEEAYLNADGSGLELVRPDSWNDEERAKKRKSLRQAEHQMEIAGEWGKALQCCQQIAERYGMTGNLRDLREVLERVEKMPKPLPPAFASALQLYLNGMDAYDGNRLRSAQEAFEKVYANTQAGFLREHALYQQASLAYEWMDFARAVNLYQKFLTEFPHSAKREAALIMTVRCALLPETKTSRSLKAGKSALALFQTEFPHSRFQQAALGLKTRVDYVEGRTREAIAAYMANGDMTSAELLTNTLPEAERNRMRLRLLTTYLRQLTTAKDYRYYEQAIVHIDRSEDALTPTEAVRFSQQLLNEPDLAAPYIYYRLYHSNLKQSDLKHLAKLADAIAARHTPLVLPPLARVRLAEVYYQEKQYPKALTWADRALTPSTSPPFDRALFVRGGTLHKLKRYKEAAACFQELLQKCPDSKLRHGAREEAAILAEALGDLSGALEQYFALNYDLDIAYLIDVRMTTGQLEEFLRRHPDASYTLDGGWDREREEKKEIPSTRHDLVRYALGIRSMRQEKWDSAKQWMKKIPIEVYREFSVGRKDYGDGWTDHPSPDPLTALADLQRLQQAVREAKTSETKAQAAYRYASYYYQHGTLLLYNPALWHSERAFAFGYFLNKTQFDRPALAQTRAYMYEHECYARALTLCLDIARRYPRSSTAPQALYRAACASRKLANFNGWWREENKQQNHWQQASSLMKQVTRRYPHHPLAKEAKKYGTVFQQEGKDFAGWNN